MRPFPGPRSAVCLPGPAPAAGPAGWGRACAFRALGGGPGPRLPSIYVVSPHPWALAVTHPVARLPGKKKKPWAPGAGPGPRARALGPGPRAMGPGPQAPGPGQRPRALGPGP